VCQEEDEWHILLHRWRSEVDECHKNSTSDEKEGKCFLHKIFIPIGKGGWYLC
jgi:hypothetical protein